MSSSLNFSLTKRDFLLRVKESGLIPPLFVEIPYTSPVSLYPIFSGPMSFLLESVKGTPKIARYSFIGFSPYLIYKLKDGRSELLRNGLATNIQESPLRILSQLTSSYRQLPDRRLPPFQGGAVGLLSYDFVRYLEKVPVTTYDDINVPDAHFLLIDKLIAFDHIQKKAWIIICPGASGENNLNWSEEFERACDELSTIHKRIALGKDINQRKSTLAKVKISHDVTEHQYVSMVAKTKEYIAAGDIFQANLSLRVSASIGETSAWLVYKVLRNINPSPFAGFMDFDNYAIVSSSPERLVRVRDGIVDTRPIAGTRPRGRSTREDVEMREDLLLNDKERAEHIMLIDLERNDIGRVCKYGTVKVDELMITEDYSHVIHIVSNITGELAPGKTLTDTIRATFPGGTITGVPKVRCMEIIDELESLRRGPYTGSIGYLGFSGNMDLNIIIRTFTIKDGMAYVQAGAGIVADSNPQREYRESLNKAEALLRTLEQISN